METRILLKKTHNNMDSTKNPFNIEINKANNIPINVAYHYKIFKPINEISYSEVDNNEIVCEKFFVHNSC